MIIVQLSTLILLRKKTWSEYPINSEDVVLYSHKLGARSFNDLVGKGDTASSVLL